MKYTLWLIIESTIFSLNHPCFYIVPYQKNRGAFLLEVHPPIADGKLPSPRLRMPWWPCGAMWRTDDKRPCKCARRPRSCGGSCKVPRRIPGSGESGWGKHEGNLCEIVISNHIKGMGKVNKKGRFVFRKTICGTYWRLYLFLFWNNLNSWVETGTLRRYMGHVQRFCWITRGAGGVNIVK